MLCHLHMEALQVGSSLMSSVWAWAACGHRLPPCSTQPWPGPGWAWPTPVLNSQIKLRQLTAHPGLLTPSSGHPSVFLSWAVTVFGFYGLPTVSLTNRSIPLTESLAWLETRRKTTSEWARTHLPLISNHRPIQLLDLTNGYQSAQP